MADYAQFSLATPPLQISSMTAACHAFYLWARAFIALAPGTRPLAGGNQDLVPLAISAPWSQSNERPIPSEV